MGRLRLHRDDCGAHSGALLIPLVWGGLDFDTAEMDAEIRALLGRVAPEGGHLRKLTLTARVRAAHRAAIWDLSEMKSARQTAQGCDLEDETPAEQALVEMITALDCLTAARAKLIEAHESFRRAECLFAGVR